MRASCVWLFSSVAALAVRVPTSAIQPSTVRCRSSVMASAAMRAAARVAARVEQVDDATRDP
eukprot:7030690-Prymnesium_polylepis.1